MFYDRLISINNSISSKEYEYISNILNEYSIVPENIEKIRSVYKVTSQGKNYCLKKLKHGNRKALKGMLLVNYLKQNGFDNFAEYIQTKDGKDCVKAKKHFYYLTEWIEGRECNHEDLDELKKAASLLADFHIKSKGFSAREARVHSNIKNWPQKLQKEKHDLIRFKKFIESKKVKTVFDTGYYDAIDMFLSFMDISIDLLNKSHYMDISNKALLEKTICHDSFYYQNVLVDASGKMYIIDLDSTIYDIHVYDLAKFIRRILYKSIYAWDFNVARELIASYSNINPLSREEYEILLAFIIFPHKFWKLGRKRYRKGKKWNDDKYIKKLNRALKYIDKQNQFIDKFISYYNISEK